MVHKFAGRNVNILWGEVEEVSGELFWCHGGEKLPSEAIVNGRGMAGLFFLASLHGEEPNLNAIPLRSNVTFEVVQCMYAKRIFEQCNSGNRTKGLAPFQQIIKKYNLYVNV